MIFKLKKIISYIKITRPINTVITFCVVVVSATICLGKLDFSLNIFLGGIAAFLTASAGNIINDYFDLEIDKINRPSRPIASGIIKQRIAYIYYCIFVLFSLVVASEISLQAFGIVFITNLFLFLYSYKLKGILLLGNIVVSICTALSFIFGGIIVGNIWSAIIPSVFAFLVTIIREIVKDIEDIEGDKKYNINTFPIKFGIKQSKLLITFFIGVLIITTFIPFILRIYKIEYFIMVLFFVDIPLVYIISKIFSEHFLDLLRKISFSLKMVMIFGLISIIVGTF